MEKALPHSLCIYNTLESKCIFPRHVGADYAHRRRLQTVPVAAARTSLVLMINSNTIFPHHFRDRPYCLHAYRTMRVSLFLARAAPPRPNWWI